MGASGSGKSTLLNILGLLDRPESGTYRLSGVSVSENALSEGALDKFRRERIGFVFQTFHILGNRTVEDNLALRLRALRVPRARWRRMIIESLAEVGLDGSEQEPASVLSGGEKQRLAVARALLGSPSLLLADEPTGNLDRANSDSVLDLLSQAAERGVAVIVITHDREVGEWADSVSRMESGVLPCVG